MHTLRCISEENRVEVIEVGGWTWKEETDQEERFIYVQNASIYVQ